RVAHDKFREGAVVGSADLNGTLLGSLADLGARADHDVVKGGLEELVHGPANLIHSYLRMHASTRRCQARSSLARGDIRDPERPLPMAGHETLRLAQCSFLRFSSKKAMGRSPSLSFTKRDAPRLK